MEIKKKDIYKIDYNITAGAMAASPTHIFGYGSNTSEQVAERVLSRLGGGLNIPINRNLFVVNSYAATLSNYVRTFGGFSTSRQCGVANIEPMNGGTVNGLVIDFGTIGMELNKTVDELLEGLDRAEGIRSNSYTREIVTIRKYEGGVYSSVQSYVYKFGTARGPPHNLPNQEYLNAVAEMLRERRERRFVNGGRRETGDIKITIRMSTHLPRGYLGRSGLTTTFHA